MLNQFFKTAFLLFLFFEVNYAQDLNPDVLLGMAVFSNDQKAASDAINKGADVNAKNESGETIIFSALIMSFAQPDNFDPGMIKLLLKHGADLNVKNSESQTPLFIACSQGYIPDEKRAELVELFISKGAKVNITARIHMFSDGTPLMYAAMNGYVKTVESLIKAGADPLAKDEYGNNTLYWVMKGDPSMVSNTDKAEIIKLLLSKGVNPDDKNESGESAISLAEESGSKLLLDALKGKSIAAKANSKRKMSSNDTNNEINQLTPNGRMFFAAGTGDLEGVKKAFEDGAELTLRDDHGNTPLLLASNFGFDISSINDKNNSNNNLFNQRFEVIKFLVENGAEVNEVNHRGENALYSAVKTLLAAGKRNLNNTAIEVIEYLVASGSDNDIEAATTPLMEACDAASPEIVDALLSKVKNINKKSNTLTPKTALAYAIGLEAFIILESNSLDEWKKSSEAASKKIKTLPDDYKPSLDPDRIKIVKALISQGVNVNLASGGVTPLKQAKAAGSDEIVKLLINAGARE